MDSAAQLSAPSRWRFYSNIGKRPMPLPLLLAALAVAAFIATPLVYIAYRGAAGGADVWLRLAQTRLAGLMFNTLSLAVAVTGGTLVIGVTLAWLVERTDLPGRTLWRWLLAMPLSIPAFIGAMVHVALWRPRGGMVPQLLSGWLGYPVDTPSPFGFIGAAAMLTLFMYPYVFLLSAAAFRTLHASLEEAARSLGRGPWGALWHVILPALKPGLGAGALLVALDILAEYGTVALLRYQTFSSAIFLQLSGRYDRSAAAVLSAVLIVLGGALLWGEVKFQGQARFYQMTGSWRPAPPTPLGRWTPLALALVLLVVGMSLVVPVVVLVGWTLQGWLDTSYAASVWRFSAQGVWGYAFNSVWSAGLAAVLAVALSLPVAYLSARYPRRTSQALARLCQVGYALPGVVIALSLILLVNRALPFLYTTPLIVVLAYVLRHMPQAVRSSEAALAQVAPTMEEAARSLGRPPLRAFVNVTLPLILPGLFAGGALVFLTSLKELPATLLLRPAGFDTLSVRVWITASEGVYTQAAPAALLLILCAAAPLYFLLKREMRKRDA
ncbi:MAG: iron ABC transporter permease [Chloroflexi bacterium]|nr:iron ABC transporter permease [Chloroflexota bacterium]MBI4314298.1 iron ABC transporter permease [Chloroflexota bacterium]